MNPEIAQVKNSVRDGQLDLALEQLNEIEVPTYIRSRIDQQCARYRINKKHEMLDDLSYEKLNVAQNRIIENILDIVDSISRTEAIESKRKQIDFSDVRKHEKLSVVENTAGTGLIFAGIGLVLMVISHFGHDQLMEITFWVGSVLLFISFLVFVYTRLFLAPPIMSSYQKTELQSRDFQLIFTDLARLLRNAHDFSTVHIRSIEQTLDVLKSGGEISKDDLQGISDKLRCYGTMSGIFDDTMNIIEDIEHDIVSANLDNLKKYTVGIEHNTQEIKQLNRGIR